MLVVLSRSEEQRHFVMVMSFTCNIGFQIKRCLKSKKTTNNYLLLKLVKKMKVVPLARTDQRGRGC